MNEAVATMRPTPWPELERFLGGWFHEDWMLDYGEADDAVRAYAEEVRAPRVAQVVGELNDLLSRGLSEADLRNLVWWQLLGRYDPTADGLTMKEWLERVTRLLRERGGARGAESPDGR